MSRDALKIAIEAARAAGSVLLEHAENFGGTKTMKGALDFSTQADHAAEDVIISTLHQAFPEYNVLSEEAGATDRAGTHTWIIDPLDGTHNFAWGFPFWMTAIALVQGNDVQVAVTYDPLRDELFTAERGGGVFLNGSPIRVSSRVPPQCMMVFGGIHAASRNPIIVPTFNKIMKSFNRDLRVIGSIVSTTSSIAAGRFDAMIGFDEKPWDAATGLLLVTEAGGRVTGMQGEAVTPFSRDYVFSNGAMHDTILRAIHAS